MLKLRESSVARLSITILSRHGVWNDGTFQCALSFSNAQVAGLLKGRKRFVDTLDGGLVMCSVEHPNSIIYL